VPDQAEYTVACFNCQSSFDALEASWCSCLVNERSLVCPSCLTCFCKGSPVYKQRFWRDAPKAMWDRKIEEHPREFTPPRNPDPSDVKRPLVLVVDDERSIQQVALRVIESLGYGMILGRDGEEGWELARRYKPDLVLTDALMPRLDGREMCKRLKQDTETAHLKVVVMTSLYTNIKYQTEGFKVFKVDDYLAKPLDFAQLRDLLQKHIESSP
jgi:CheY-like chemotaxis protein